MPLEGLQEAVSAASGLAKATVGKAAGVARSVLLEGPLREAGDQAHHRVHAAAGDLATTGRAGRDLLVGIVRSETERAVGAMGLAPADEVTGLRAHVARLERRVIDLEEGTAAEIAVTASAATARSRRSAPKTATAPKPTAKKAPAKKTTAKKAPVRTADATPATGTAKDA